MIDQNKDLFKAFKKIHDQYEINPKPWRKVFNEEGEKILAVIRTYEGRLCSHTENGGYGRFSGNLVEKFWMEIRNYFSKIDEIGLS